ncbi:MAG TPA: LLM class flavin-dependent oxidoreductase [Pseudonocardia sp.]|nr:LLM class flavin-dependent oxidoreductase [Pseudonocardia sp.]
MALELTCAFNTSLESHEHARIAEQLGYERAWFYDSPALYCDVWVQLCRAAERTERISLGPGVMIPSMRHPMVTAAAISQLVTIAGQERVSIAVGSGFTGRLTMGKRPLKWGDVADYVRVVKALLHGDRVEWDGGLMQMMQPPGFGAPRPIDVKWVVAAAGPKGIAVAEELGDGAFGAPLPVRGFDWSTALTFGTVLEEGEDPGSERAIAAAGHAASVMLHWAVEFDQLDMVPGGDKWAAAYDALPDGERHLALHDGHLIAVNDRDRPFVTGEVLAAGGLALSPEGWRERLAQLEQDGATAVAYQPAGPDIPRELEAFAEVCRG